MRHIIGSIRSHRVARDQIHPPVDLRKCTLNVVVHAPHHGNLKFNLPAAEGENIHDLTERSDSLQELLECACGGIAACSTCHVILNQNDFDALDHPDEAELDMLDLAWGVTPTSRLGCQLKLTQKSNNITIVIPANYNNLH
jgi:ferredoxin